MDSAPTSARIDTTARPVPAEAQEIVAMARDFRHFLDQQDQRQQELARVVSALPQTMGALPELVRQQTRLADLVAQQLMYARQRDEQIEKTLARITQGVEQQRDVMGLVQQQLDENHESAVQVAQGVTTLARAVEQLQNTSERSTQALQGLLERTNERDAYFQKQYTATQNWMLGLFIMAFGTLAAGVILAAVALESARNTPARAEGVSGTTSHQEEASTSPASAATTSGTTASGAASPASGSTPGVSSSARPSTTLPALGGAAEPVKAPPPSAIGG